MAGQKTPILPSDKPPRVEVTVCKFALEQSQSYILAKFSKISEDFDFSFSLEGESWFSDRIWTPNIYIANEVLKVEKPIYNPNKLIRRLPAM